MRCSSYGVERSIGYALGGDVVPDFFCASPRLYLLLEIVI